MGTSYTLNRGSLDTSNVTEAAAADPATEVAVTFTEGITPNDQVLALRALADYVLEHGDPAGAAAAP